MFEVQGLGCVASVFIVKLDLRTFEEILRILTLTET